MGKFNNKISAEFHPPKKWILERALSYQNDEMEESSLQSVGVKCPASKITCDYRAAEGVLDTHPNADTVVSNYKAAKKASDKVFLMAMKDADPAVPKWKMYAAYYAVVLCGRWSIVPKED